MEIRTTRKRSIMTAFWAMMTLLVIPVRASTKEKKEAAPVDPTMAAIRKVYVTGQKKHEVNCAKKRLAHFTCLGAVDFHFRGAAAPGSSC